ncbi:TolC family protein [Lutimonas zeaxanthinifaciens]|uniref:TolC family protein n=1 Tax=Lutimonas zeaxanthinifaciens TaxID=3060215 RepID=UPI00265C97F0|nr:TolC family protein [Lutimonas sp. YSD2104]WKK66702.1 TolC family protein [Lutimonas sp. YSD2104]
MKKKFLLLFLVLSTVIFGQNNLTETELEMIQLSLQKSYELKNANNDLMIDSIESKAIRQNFIPTLTMNGGYAYGSANLNVDIPTFDLPISGTEIFNGSSQFDADGHFFYTNLTAKMLLFSGLQVNYGSKASKEKIKAKNFMVESERAKIIKEVIDTFDKIELLEQSKSVITESEKRLVKERLKVNVAIENGLATPFEREKIAAAELNLASKKMELEGNLRLLRLKLSMLTGKELSQIEKYEFDLKPWLFTEQSQSYEDRPELNALRSSIQAYEYKLKMNKNNFLPKVQAFATLSYFNLFDTRIQTPYDTPISEQPINLDLNYFEGFPAYLVGVGFEWDIFTGLKNDNEIQKTSIEKNMAENKKSDAEEKLKLFEQKVKIEFDVKSEQVLLKEKEKDVASNSLKLAIASYREGLINITERLQAETEYQQAVLDYYKMIALQRQAALELLIASGSLQVNNLNN